MTLTTLQQVRLKIADVPIAENLTLYGDGTATVFHMQHANLSNGAAYVPAAGASAWSATGCAIDVSGMFIFSNVISANSAFNVRYQHTNFSDDEIQQFVTEGGGSINGAALAALGALSFDAIKRARWMASDGSQYDDTSAQNHIRELMDKFEAEVAKESIEGGGFGSWSEGQAMW